MPPAVVTMPLLPLDADYVAYDVSLLRLLPMTLPATRCATVTVRVEDVYRLPLMPLRRYALLPVSALIQDSLLGGAVDTTA